MQDDLCPCGTDNLFQDCCGAIHAGLKEAETAEQLMRSRYSAFVKEDGDYLLHSWHKLTRPSSIDFDNNTKWLGLKITSTKAGLSQDSEGWVSFVARYKVGGKAERITENSYFTRLEGRWVYHSANHE